MEIYDYTVEKEESGIRIDRYLAEKDSGLSRSFIQKLLKDGQITVGDKAAKSNYKVRENDRIHLEIPDSSEPDIVPEDIPLDILYEDEDVLIVNKPKGMVVHPAAGHYQGTLVNAVMAHCGDSLSGINGVMRPGIVHRIDKDTTGALLVCKNDTAHRDLAEQLKCHSIRRRYRAVVQGNLKEDEGTIEGPIGRHPTDRKKWPSITKWERCGNTLQSTGTFWTGNLCGMPARNRAYPSDPRAYGQHRTSTSGRYGIWVFKKSLSSGGTGSSCNDSWVCSSTYL